MLEKLLGLLKPDVSIEAKVAGISIFIGKQLDKFNGRIESLEARQLQKGDKGDKGDSVKGDKGDKGDPGKDGIGIQGPAGKDGVGKDGKDGVSVVNSYIAADGSLVLVLSNGTEIDAGEISGFSGQISQFTQLSNTPVTETLSTVTKTADYIVQYSDYTVRADATSIAITIILPPVPQNGQIFHIKKVDSTVNSVTISGNGFLIDGQSTWVIGRQYNNIMAQYDAQSTTWNIL